MYCRCCGKNIKDTARFCGYCGSEVSMEVRLRTEPSSTKSQIRQNIWLFLMAYIYFIVTILHLYISRLIGSYGIEHLMMYYNISGILFDVFYGIVLGGLVVFTIINARSVKWLYMIPVILLCVYSMMSNILIKNYIGLIGSIPGLALVIIISNSFRRKWENRQVTKKMLLIPVLVACAVYVYGYKLAYALIGMILTDTTIRVNWDFLVPLELAGAMIAVLMTRIRKTQ